MSDPIRHVTTLQSPVIVGGEISFSTSSSELYVRVSPHTAPRLPYPFYFFDNDNAGGGVKDYHVGFFHHMIHFHTVGWEKIHIYYTRLSSSATLAGMALCL